MSIASTSGSRPSSLRTAWILLLLATVLLSVSMLEGSRRDLLPHPGRVRSRDAVSIDVLTASQAELQFLPGVGRGIARSMHHGIRQQGLRSLQELEALSGIGPARADAIRSAVGSEAR